MSRLLFSFTLSTLAFAAHGQQSLSIDPNWMNSTNSQTQQSVFCSRMDYTFSVMLHGSGPTNAAKHRLEVLSLIDQLRAGNIAEYLPIQVKLGGKSREQYLSLSRVLQSALDIDPAKKSALVLSTTDLRFLPHMQEHTELILVSNTSEPLDPKRAAQVAAAARRANIVIHVIWYGSEIKDYANLGAAASVAYLSRATQGRFVSLAGQTNPCGSRS